MKVLFQVGKGGHTMPTKPKLSPAVKAEADLYLRMPMPEPVEPDGPYGTSDDTGIPDYDRVLPPHILKTVQNAWKAAQAIFIRAGICIGDSEIERRIFLILCQYVYDRLKDMAKNPQDWIVDQRAIMKEDSLFAHTDPDEFLKLLTDIDIPPE
jgi:hypothetical protein